MAPPNLQHTPLFSRHRPASSSSGTWRASAPAAGTKQAIERDLIGAWSGRAVTDIGKMDVIELLDGIQDAGHYRARNMRLTQIRRMFDWFSRTRRRADQPSRRHQEATGEEPPARADRRRIAGDLECRGRDTEPAGTFVKLLMLTAQRRTEVATIEWSEIDKAAKLWTVPESKYKTGMVHLVPLAASVLDLLDGLPKFKDGDRLAKHALSYSNGKRPMICNFARLKDDLDRLKRRHGVDVSRHPAHRPHAPVADRHQRRRCRARARAPAGRHSRGQ